MKNTSLTPSAVAVIVAAGSSSRMASSTNKIFMSLLDRPLLSYTLEAFQNSETISSIILVTREEFIFDCKNIAAQYGISKLKTIVTGGNTRQESVMNGLSEIDDSSLVAIHDGARALITPNIINTTVHAAYTHSAAAPGVKCKDTLKSIDENGFIRSTIDRESVYHIQTPQTFYCKDIRNAHIFAVNNNITVTDDCSLIQMFSDIKIKIVDSTYDNLKITTAEDIHFAEAVLKKREGMI